MIINRSTKLSIISMIISNLFICSMIVITIIISSSSSMIIIHY